MNLKQLLCAASLALVTLSAHAVDGCTVVLCLANPAGWDKISQCVPPIEQLFRDLAEGDSFPSCNMNGSSSSGQNSATSSYASGSNCPAQYRYMTGPNGDIPACSMIGVITVSINGQPWNETWWNYSGSVTKSYPSAIASGASNDQWQQSLAAFNQQQAATSTQSNGN